MFKHTRKWLALAALTIAASAAFAQDFPTRPVKILVPQTPGGASDALARIIAQKLTEKWGQPVVVENRAGAGGNVGMEVVANAAADGYTLLMSYVAPMRSMARCTKSSRLIRKRTSRRWPPSPRCHSSWWPRPTHPSRLCLTLSPPQRKPSSPMVPRVMVQ
jgi:hypothetical protein